MSESEESKMSQRIRPQVVLMIIIALMMGMMGLNRVMGSPHFQSYRTMDVVQLVLSGASIGGAFTVSMMLLFRQRL